MGNCAYFLAKKKDNCKGKKGQKNRQLLYCWKNNCHFCCKYSLCLTNTRQQIAGKKHYNFRLYEQQNWTLMRLMYRNAITFHLVDNYDSY